MDLRPNVDLGVTIPNQYGKLLEEICAEDCLRDENGEISLLEQAVTDWYDNTYIPLAETIRDRGLLRWFPGRTITDLYLWILENRSGEKELGWELNPTCRRIDPEQSQAETGSWRRADDDALHQIFLRISSSRSAATMIAGTRWIRRSSSRSVKGPGSTGCTLSKRLRKWKARRRVLSGRNSTGHAPRRRWSEAWLSRPVPSRRRSVSGPR
jgi:hypothetical protein